MLGVGVERRIEAAARVLHVAPHPVCRLRGDARVERCARRGVGVRVDREQLRVVVQHLFEVRDRPLAVHAVAAEAAAELVVQAAARHAVQRMRDHRERALVRFLAAARVPHGEQQLDRGGVREFRRVSKAAVLLVEALREALARVQQRCARERREVVADLHVFSFERIDQPYAALLDLALVVARTGGTRRNGLVPFGGGDGALLGTATITDATGAVVATGAIQPGWILLRVSPTGRQRGTLSLGAFTLGTVAITPTTILLTPPPTAR